MKKTITKLFALVMALVLVMSSAIGVSALEGSANSVLTGRASGNTLTDATGNSIAGSANQAGEFSGSKPLGIFGLDYGDYTFSAFLIEQDGNKYLITSIYLYDIVSEGDIPLYTSRKEGYYEYASYVGHDDWYCYLTAPDLNDFYALPIDTSVASSGYLYFESKSGNTLYYSAEGFGSMTRLRNGDDVVFVNEKGEVYMEYLGAPIVAVGASNYAVFGMGGVYDGYPAFFTFTEWTFNANYAIGASGGKSGGGTSTGGGSGTGGGTGGGGSTGGGTGGSGTEEEPGGLNMTALLIIVAVVIGAVLLLRNNNKKKSDVSKGVTAPGGFDPTVPNSGPVDLPLGGMGTIPVGLGGGAGKVSTNWQLRGTSGSFSGQTFPISGTIRIGRSSSCQIVFPDGTPGISGSHCELSLESGGVVLRDLGSSYGTMAKGSKLAPNTPCFLSAGDSFTLAKGHSFQLENTGAPAPVSASPIAIRDLHGKIYQSQSGRITIGRDSGSKVVLPDDDKAISANHCVLYRENGKLYLMDQESTNGTFFSEEERLKPNTPYRIRKGQAFFLANRKHTYVVTED